MHATIRPAYRVSPDGKTAKRWGFEMIVNRKWHSRSALRRDLEIAASDMGAEVTTQLV